MDAFVVLGSSAGVVVPGLFVAVVFGLLVAVVPGLFVAVVPDLQDAIKKMKQNGIVTYAAHLNGTEYQKSVFKKDIALLIGNEAKGLSDEVSNMADKLIKIPMEGKVESLNAAVATAILIYEARR